MRISKFTLAREWLFFLMVFPLGFPACFFLGYYSGEFRHAYFTTSYLSHHNVNPNWSYDAFLKDAFGLGSLQSLARWFVPYLAVMVLRSIYWSINTLRARKPS